MVELTYHDWDVVIVGAGQLEDILLTYLYVAKECYYRRGNEFGRPFQCAGLVTPNAMKQVNL